MAQNDSKLTGLKKRQQLAQTSKNIFIWVAAAAVVVTICGVVMQFLVAQVIFNQSVINKKIDTNQIVEQNITNATQLKKNVDALVADSNLAAVKVTSVDASMSSNLQVILDALPTTSDSATFANSLSKVILPLSGVSVETLTAGDTNVTVTTTTSEVGPQTLGFSMSVRGSYDQISAALSDIERVIRPIKITKLVVQGSDAQLSATIEGVTYFVPSSGVQLGTESMKP